MAEKEWKTKTEIENKSNKQKTMTNLVAINPTISIITVNVNGLSTLIRKQRCKSVQKTRPNMFSARNSL